MDRERWHGTGKSIYLHTKQIHYLVVCPPCKARGRREVSCICDGRGKVPLEIAEQFLERREGL